MWYEDVIVFNTDPKRLYIATPKNADSVLILCRFLFFESRSCANGTYVSKTTPRPRVRYLEWYIFAYINNFLTYLLIILANAVSYFLTILICSLYGGSGIYVLRNNE